MYTEPGIEATACARELLYVYVYVITGIQVILSLAVTVTPAISLCLRLRLLTHLVTSLCVYRHIATLNIGKTKAMLFGGKPGDTVILSAGGSSIENVSEYKYLGVILDDHLRFDSQVEYVAAKARRAFAKVNRLFDGRKGISVKMGLELYKCLVRPHLEFAVGAWASVQDKGVRLMEKVQYECLRQITGAYCHSSADALDN